ncbi:hypothetical protein D7Y21_28415 [Corallococcus sp. AB045]|uniref:hypothetical protein n=1 Tax=Corallococcus sp. AB045 TaxID=2316719 RepID=UPI000EC9A3AF|nr:hypothetical protein [Corallococcus sp. AB045]RKH82501.1 hypothetical protein D7Y21_28415 [Corallococcus sp. AB045]
MTHFNFKRCAQALVITSLLAGCEGTDTGEKAAGSPPADVTRAVATLVSPQPGQSAAMTWNFENTTSVGAVSNSVGESSAGWLTGAATQTGGGPAENWGSPWGTVLLTRAFGTEYPFIDFTTTEPVKLESLTFLHYHNHNPGYPTAPSYLVQLQLDRGCGFVDIGNPITASQATQSTTATVALNDMRLPAGTYRLRWVPRNLAFGSNTSSEFFAVGPVTLNVVTASSCDM